MPTTMSSTTSLAQTISNPDVAQVFDQYPNHIRPQMLALRQSIIEAADESEEISKLEETLKWGEPSYLTKIGSTLRIDWKAATPDHYQLYCHCKTLLIETFREIYPDTFCYDGNRAIVFTIDEPVPFRELKRCITLALTYHRCKHLPLLGHTPC